MGTITMTEFNQQVSAVARRVVEQGETVRVTNRGRVVLRLVPEPESSGEALEALVASGLATGPTSAHQPRVGRERVEISKDLDELLEETRSDASI